MNWLHTATIILHVLLASGIVALVLLQRGRGADAGAGFGSGASGTVFGARGSASFMSRTTATLAGLFIATSLTLAYMGGRKVEAPSSVIDRVQLPASETTENAVTLPALPAESNSTNPPASGDPSATPPAPSETPVETPVSEPAK